MYMYLYMYLYMYRFTPLYKDFQDHTTNPSAPTLCAWLDMARKMECSAYPSRGRHNVGFTSLMRSTAIEA